MPFRSLFPVLLGLTLTTIACSSGETQTPAEAAPQEASPSAAATPEPTATSSGSVEISDACSLLTSEDIQEALGLAAEMTVEERELPDINKYNDDAYGCAWQWQEGQVSLQVTHEPAGNKFDTWASRLVAARLEKGFASIEGPGDGAVFHAEDSHLVWHRGERWMFSLSFAGPSREAQLEQAKLVDLGQRIELR